MKNNDKNMKIKKYKIQSQIIFQIQIKVKEKKILNCDATKLNLKLIVNGGPELDTSCGGAVSPCLIGCKFGP